MCHVCCIMLQFRGGFVMCHVCCIMLLFRGGFVMCRVCAVLCCVFRGGLGMCHVCSILCCLFRGGLCCAMCVLYYVAVQRGLSQVCVLLLVLCDCYVASWVIGVGVAVVQVLISCTEVIDVEIFYCIPVFLFVVMRIRSSVLYIVIDYTYGTSQNPH